MNSINDESRYICSGCGACSTVCDFGAVRLKMDSTGFFQAEIDDEKCTHCGKCRKVCMRFADEICGVNLYSAGLYALQSADRKVLRNSASGGIAHELALMALQNNETVSGAAYNRKKNIAEHILVRETDDLRKLDGSKYLQSNTMRAFRSIAERAREDSDSRFCIFGLPCQIAGFRLAAEMLKIRDRVLLVELFCHGVPTYKLWEKELDRVSNKIGTRQFKNVRFRDKSIDWHNYCLIVRSADRLFRGKRERELFWQVYFESILLGDSCYQCRFRKEESCADIRLGDYWGPKYQFNKEGVSAVYVCTPEGEKAVRDLIESGRVRELETTTAAEMLARQNMQGYVRTEKIHAEAMEKLRNEEDIERIIKDYRKKQPAGQKIKRGIMSAGSVLPDRLRIELKKKVSFALMQRKR